MNVTGTVTLGGSNLALTLLSAPVLDQQFTIVQNDSTDTIPTSSSSALR